MLALLSVPAFTTLCGSCNTPTLPIPPPNFTLERGAPGYALVSGSQSDAGAAAYVLAYNRDLERGVFERVDALGFRIEVPADPGHWIIVYGVTATWEFGMPSDPRVVPP
ncbi:MAG: hypothetical protein QME96_05365 [Myxococcota bacterium]|nr:hypothetical protein [Myxococcota bacterium]